MHIDLKESDFNKTIAPWLGKTFKMMKGHIADVFKQNNIQVTQEQWVVLKILNEDHDGIIQNNLAFITNRNKASLTRLINVMEKNNLVVRIPSKDDSRKKLIYKTKTGQALFDKMHPIMMASVLELQTGLSKKEKTQFISTLKKIQNNIINKNN